MISIKSPQEIKIMREGGKILADVVRQTAKAAKVGTTLRELDGLAEKLIRQAGAEPAFLGYKPPWSDKSYPASICASVNDMVVHGLPTERKLEEGDVLKIDLGVFYKGFYTDTAVTVGVGKISGLAEKLISATRQALNLAIRECRSGKTVGDIGFAVAKSARKNGFVPVRGLTGHGIGEKLHEEPTVFNEGRQGKGVELESGMVLAIEPMISAGSAELKELPDGSFATRDGSLSAHFEHTIAIMEKGPVILTAI